MKRIITIIGIITMIAVVGLAMTGCEGLFDTEGSGSGKDPNKDPSDPKPPSPSLRYQTVPYAPGGDARALDSDIQDKLIYSGYNGTKYYYVFLLGHINHVPVAYRQPVIYNGVTPITISYSISNATTESVSQAAQTAIENSTTRTTGVSANIESQIGFKTGIVNGSLSLNVGANASWGSGSSRSVSNTYETMTSSTMQVEDSISATIGNNSEPSGKYRYSLMGTTDVYYVLATTNAKVKTDEYFSVCARGDSFAWGIDYEPELGGNFGKTAGGELLVVPEMVLTDLPTPTKQIESDELPPATPVATPTISPSGSSLTSATSATISCSTSGATIYYTMSSTGTPADPTESSTRYTGSIALAQNLTQTTYTIKARAYHPSMPASSVMTKTYTMSATPLKTQFIKDDFSNINWTSFNMDYAWVITDFDKPRLTSEGYTHFIVTIEFNITSVSYSNVTGHVYKGHIHPVNDSATALVWINSSSQNTTGLKTATSNRIAIADYNNELTADWMGGPSMGAPSGSSIAIGSRKVTIEARKN